MSPFPPCTECQRSAAPGEVVVSHVLGVICRDCAGNRTFDHDAVFVLIREEGPYVVQGWDAAWR